MADITDGGGWPDIEYKIDIKIKYDGLYSKYVDEIYFRGEHHLIESWGMSIRSDYINYSKYSFYRSLDKNYPPELIDLINIEELIREELINKNDNYITKNDIILHEREMKMMKVRKQMKKEKSILFKIMKIFKRK